MSNFLHSVVRRGAGLPLPVSVRPASGPLPLPGQAVASPYPGEQDPGLSAEPIRTLEPVVSTEIQIAQSDGTFTSPNAALDQATSITEKPLDAPVAPQLSPLALPGITPPALAKIVAPTSPVGETKNAKAATTQIFPAVIASETGAPFPEADGPGQIVKSIPVEEAPAILRPSASPHPPHPMNDAIKPAAVSSTQEHVQVAVVPKATEKASAPERVNKSAAPEQRNIQVKIGRVEIRSNQPAPVLRTPLPRNTGGFDDFTLARTYLDRNRG